VPSHLTIPLLRRASRSLAAWLRLEPSAGKSLLAATGFALLWANLDEDSYRSFWDTKTAIGPGWLRLDLSLAGWAADGLLAIFFFLAGMEVKREFVTAGSRVAERPRSRSSRPSAASSRRRSWC
jgi:Na+:H+ antiporter, NhaA family